MKTIRTFALICLILPLGACIALTGEEATQTALGRVTKVGFTAEVMEGSGFTHEVFSRVQPNADTLWVFIEGDGSPWVNGGTQVADNPTARKPLALQLTTQTPNAIYLGRPCYLRAHRDARCSPKLWTEARYSDAVVRSMNSALQTALKRYSARKVVLVGYSGGGTLATLMAQSAPKGIAVVTIAGNLDTEAWTRQHGYAALVGRNPATEPPLSNVLELHLVGDRDKNVTSTTTARYLQRIPPSQIWHYANFDHVCCWAADWQAIASRIQAAVSN